MNDKKMNDVKLIKSGNRRIFYIDVPDNIEIDKLKEFFKVIKKK